MNSSAARVHSESAWAARIPKAVLWVVISLTAILFAARGPVRYFRIPGDWNDFSQNYTASKLWLNGESPADPKNFVALWKQQSHSRLDLTDIRTHLAPPLGGLVTMAPVAALPWNIAKPLWLSLLLLSFGATVWSLARLVGRQWNDSVTMIFVAACLGFAPFHTGVANGNTTVLVIGLCALALWWASSDNDLAAGIAFGFACSLKPQIGAFLVLYYLLGRRWRLCTIAVGWTVALNLIATLYLRLRGVSWFHDYVNNARGFVTNNNIDSFTSENPGRFSLINLQVPFFSITGRSGSANLLAFAITAILVCAWAFWILRKSRIPELLSLGTVSAITLLPVYHRFYDAGLLAIPLLWCIEHVTDESKGIARWGLLLIVPFFFPGSAVLERISSSGRLPDFIANSPLWTTVILPHENWSILLLCLVLLFGMRNYAAPPNDYPASSNVH